MLHSDSGKLGKPLEDVPERATRAVVIVNHIPKTTGACEKRWIKLSGTRHMEIKRQEWARMMNIVIQIRDLKNGI